MGGGEEEGVAKLGDTGLAGWEGMKQELCFCPFYFRCLLNVQVEITRVSVVCTMLENKGFAQEDLKKSKKKMFLDAWVIRAKSFTSSVSRTIL